MIVCDMDIRSHRSFSIKLPYRSILERIEYVSSDFLCTVHLFAEGCFDRAMFVMVFGEIVDTRTNLVQL